MTTKKDNIKIWQNTVEECTKKDYCKSVSVIYKNLLLTPIPRYEKTTIKVVNNDTLSCCESLMESNHNILALNMASPSRPGGGIGSGSFTQEENCFRRSNYFQSLKKDLYPIPETGCIYTPIITVIKDKYYNLLEKPFSISMVACAALRSPPQLNGKYINKNDRQMTKHKIEQIFQIGYQMNHDTLVLGAFGCGAFRNNPEEVALIFNEVIDQYHNCFKLIIFAVMSYKDENYTIFNKIIKQQ